MNRAGLSRVGDFAINSATNYGVVIGRRTGNVFLNIHKRKYLMTRESLPPETQRRRRHIKQQPPAAELTTTSSSRTHCNLQQQNSLQLIKKKVKNKKIKNKRERETAKKYVTDEGAR